MEEPAVAEEPMAEDGAYGESPMLAERVAAGELPPVEERLPIQPFVVTNRMLTVSYDTEIGKYGGTMRLPQDGPGGDPHFFIGSNEPLLWAPGAFNYDMGIYGNVLLDWETNEDFSSFTLHMREGLKWSDGTPVTSADVDFAWNDVILNEESHLPRPHTCAQDPIFLQHRLRSRFWMTIPLPLPLTDSMAVFRLNWLLPSGEGIRISSSPAIT
jgi:ABC-type transport system substrate-binding protein